MYSSTAYIYSNDVKICQVIYREFDEHTFEYIFYPYYDAIDSLVNFKGIQGIDLNLRREKYVRKNMLPVFIFEHSPLSGKKSFYKANRIAGMTLLEYLSNCKLQYFGDNLYIRSE